MDELLSESNGGAAHLLNQAGLSPEAATNITTTVQSMDLRESAIKIHTPSYRPLSGGAGGCSLERVRKTHDGQCEACEMRSATLYYLRVGQLQFKICCSCKASIHNGIERADGPDCY